MRKTTFLGKALTVLALAAAAPATAQEKKIDVKPSLTALRHDIFRGFQPPIGAAFAPAVDVHACRLSVQGEAFFYTGHNSSVEPMGLAGAKVQADYEVPITGKLTGSLGYKIFTFPAFDVDRSQEFRVSLRYDNKFKPGLFLAYDFEHFSGLYAELSASRKIGPFAMSWTASYNSNFGREGSGLIFLQEKAALPLKVGDFEVEPSISYHKGLKDDFYTGVNAGVSVSKNL